MPIEFDQDVNEYHLVFGDVRGSKAILYHCPFCGGAAPRSKRELLFATLDNREVSRLRALTKKIKTVDELLKTLGVPDRDLDAGVTMAEKRDGQPDRVDTFRTLIYSQQSKSADIRVAVTRTGQVAGITFESKYLGLPHRS